MQNTSKHRQGRCGPHNHSTEEHDSSTGRLRPDLFVGLWLVTLCKEMGWGQSLKSAVTEEHIRLEDSYYFCSALNCFPFLNYSTLPWRLGGVIEKQFLHQERHFFLHFWHAPLGNHQQRSCLQILIWRVSVPAGFGPSCISDAPVFAWCSEWTCDHVSSLSCEQDGLDRPSFWDLHPAEFGRSRAAVCTNSLAAGTSQSSEREQCKWKCGVD